jgi:hypothetical protein
MRCSPGILQCRSHRGSQMSKSSNPAHNQICTPWEPQRKTHGGDGDD